MKTVARRLLIFGAVDRVEALNNAFILFLSVNSLWMMLTTAPSNSVRPSLRIVMGLKAFQRMFSQMLVAMKREMPDPIPYPAWSISSSMMTTHPAKVNWSTIIIALPKPISSMVP